ncbi:MAG: transposase, partial [Deltaproteobacteria bacterium]|nr:transposase [Deltaproteobacteria bacterium]
LFKGNTNDFDTFDSQVKKAVEEFGCQRVTFVGDRGMIKSGQITELKNHDKGLHYITAITKPQIEKLIKNNIIQLGLFDSEICEVVHDETRYLLRRNPIRGKEIEINRQYKRKSIERLIHVKNQYLETHSRASVDKAISVVNDRINKLRVQDWIKVDSDGITLNIHVDDKSLADKSRLDGCYVIKSDLPTEINKQVVHDRYKQLAEVEHAFRDCKTIMLEMRPWYVQTEKSTRGAALVVMLAYLIARHLEKLWTGFDSSVQEGISQLSTLCTMEVTVKGNGTCNMIPTPRENSNRLLKAAKVRIPDVLPHLGVNVLSIKKLRKSATD